LDFLSANHRARNEKLKRLDFLKPIRQSNYRRVHRLGKAAKGRCVRKELLAKRYTLAMHIEAHRANNESRICVHTEHIPGFSAFLAPAFPACCSFFMHIVLRSKNSPIVCRLNMMIVLPDICNILPIAIVRMFSLLKPPNSTLSAALVESPPQPVDLLCRRDIFLKYHRQSNHYSI
jgi:hypothetical protein